MGGGGSGGGNKRRQQKQKSKAKSRAQDAFSIANKELGGDRQHKLTPRNRELDADLGNGKRRRNADDDEDEEDEDGEDDEDEAPPRKRGRAGQDQNGDDVEYGSDSSGNEWRIGVGEGDEDSDIDSDEAFGESDDEKFQGYSFGGSQKKGKKKSKKHDSDDEEDDEDDDDLESLGSDAIDLADALDMSMSDDDDQGDAEEDEDSDEEELDSDDSEDSEESEDDVSESGVKDFVNKFSGVAEDEDEIKGPQKSKIHLSDLGLLGGLDPTLKKSLKLMSKEEKSSKPQKLEVPLARRQQARLDRAAAYEQANKTLDRWNETVKQNRRADHLVFPLAQTETGLVRHDNTEIAPLDSKTPGNELESTIMGLVEASGFAPKSEEEPKEYLDENGEPITRKQFWALKRKERELKSREEARAKRIKKIKSKAYHRVHRREREKNEMKEHEELAAAGLVDSEDEREQRDRQRAAERMGARHKDSKWAKMARKGGLAVWDDSVRDGMNDMARRDEELRRRVEGRGDGSDDDDSDYSGDSEDADDRKRLLKQLQSIDEDDSDSGPKSKLMNMPFMKKAENARKKENDDLIKQIRRELLSDDDVSEPEPEADDIGRRQFGAPGAKELGSKEPIASKSRKEKSKRDATDTPMVDAAESTVDNAKALPASTSWTEAVDDGAGAWSSAVPSKPRKARKDKALDNGASVLDVDSGASVVRAPEPAPRSKPNKKHAIAIAGDSSDDEDDHLVQFRDQELLDKAFGGLDVVAEFEAEKHAQEEEDDEKVIDNTLPGWGSWVGDGVSAKEKKRHAGRFLTKQDGIKKDKRKDAKLKNVIMNEKIVKKNNKYLASQLPHTFENSAQYERSLRLPVGPEWVTKKTHQDAVKPKVIIKQGIIAPMAKPLH
ncbi:hypothetical protein G7054_g13463 [Neopestalotiopsis clavispora]|nr:hypothetical protein G7054_g13463 [Neopestalotiopsis clavispora]